MFFSIGEVIPLRQYSSKGMYFLRQPEQGQAVALASPCQRKRGALPAAPLVPLVGICIGCESQPALHKGFRLSFIAFGVFQMSEYKNAVKCCLDLIKHHSSPNEVSVGFLLSFGPLFTTVFSWNLSPTTSLGPPQVYVRDFLKLHRLFCSPRRPFQIVSVGST